MWEESWYLDNSPKKSVWTSTVKRNNYEHWRKSITQSIPYYKSLQYLSCENLEKGTLHPILKINCKSKGDLRRLPIKLKLLTEAYILQSNRIKIYKNELNILCLLCEKDGEVFAWPRDRPKCVGSRSNFRFLVDVLYPVVVKIVHFLIIFSSSICNRSRLSMSWIICSLKDDT
jgi:hypothetical protein